MNNNIIVPFDAGNAIIVPGEDGKFKIVITSGEKGIKYEFDASPAGIDSFSVAGGQIKTYSK